MNTKYFLPFIGIIGVFVMLFIVALLPKPEKQFAPPPKEWMKDTVFTQPFVSDDKPDSLQWRIEPTEE